MSSAWGACETLVLAYSPGRRIEGVPWAGKRGGAYEGYEGCEGCLVRQKRRGRVIPPHGFSQLTIPFPSILSILTPTATSASTSKLTSTWRSQGKPRVLLITPCVETPFFGTWKRSSARTVASASASLQQGPRNRATMSQPEKAPSTRALDREEMDLAEITEKLRSGLEIKDRTYLLKTYKSCFVGSEAVAFMIKSGMVSSEEDGVHLGNLLMQQKVFHHVVKDHTFKNAYLFYRFAQDETERSHGKVAVDQQGEALSWLHFLKPKALWVDEAEAAAYQPKDRSGGSAEKASDLKDSDLQKAAEEIEVSPLDKYNVELLDNVHPVKWINPKPAGRYNLVVIGAGAGGLVTAAGAAGVSAKVALVEMNLLGGDCLNVGCVPSKALIKSAKVAATVRNPTAYGVDVKGEVSVDFPKVMERLRRLRAEISVNDSAKRFTEDLGVDVYFGRGEFKSPTTLEVAGEVLHFSKAVIATGATAAVPDIPGLDKVPYLTNSTVFNLTRLPARLGVIGAGPIGSELAQAFQRFGSKVVLLNRSKNFLGKEDRDAADIVQDQITKEGVDFRLGINLKSVELVSEADPDNGKFFPEIKVTFLDMGRETLEEVVVDALLVATGRKPNVAGLGLDKAGVKVDKNGVVVDDNLRTTQKNIFAVGDVCTMYKFTHVADFMARMVVRNALFFGREKFSNLLVPWVTYTEPEVAHVGLYEEDLKEAKTPYDVYMRQFKDVDRAIVDGETEGFVKFYTKKSTDQIIGATIVGTRAGDLISEVTLAIQSGIGLGRIATVIHPYPTCAEAIRQCGDAYNRTRLTPIVKAVFRKLMGAQR